MTAGGFLTGKYLGGAEPEGARHTAMPDFQPRYATPAMHAAALKYKALAERKGLSLLQLAVAWCAPRGRLVQPPLSAGGGAMAGASVTLPETQTKSVRFYLSSGRDCCSPPVHPQSAVKLMRPWSMRVTQHGRLCSESHLQQQQNAAPTAPCACIPLF